MKTKSQKKSLFVSMNPYLKGFKIPFIIAVIGAIISAVITVYGPNVLSDITDMVTAGLMGNMDLDGISKKAFTLSALYGISAVIGYSQSFVVITIVQRFSQRLRTAISEKINRVPLNYFDSHKQGDTLSRVTNDVDTMGQSLGQSVGTIVTSFMLLIGAIVMMFHTNWILALTAIGSVFAGFVFVAILMGASQRFFKQQQTNLANLSGFVEETYTGHNVVTSYNAVEESKKQFANYNNALRSSMWKSQFISGIMMPMMGFIGNFGYVMVAIVGAILTINGDITFGTIVAFITYVRIFTNPLSQMAQALTQWQQASAAMTRVFEFLEEDEMEDDSHKQPQLSQPKGNVIFDKVMFGYLPGQTIINNFSAEAKPGQKIAIVGPTGAGKTTIVNLLMKFYPINEGHIYIDGVDTHDMSRSEVHDQFSMVLQDTWLFEGTIMDNLIYNQEHVNSEMAVEAAKAVGVHHFIMTLSKGYDTVLDDTVTLSAGQKQLLTIARALLKESPLLILDEATSSVDTRTEELIQKAMDKLMEGRTSFVIAHRLSTIRNADLILVMKDGNIIEQGNHDALMSQNGFYADLYNSQFEAA